MILLAILLRKICKRGGSQGRLEVGETPSNLYPSHQKKLLKNSKHSELGLGRVATIPPKKAITVLRL